MSFVSMAKEMTGEFSNVDLSFAKLKINEALKQIYDENDWSFQTATAGWLAPGLVASSGTFTVTPYVNTITADASATAALNQVMLNPPLLTTLQYRDPSRSLYNIVQVGYAGTVANVFPATPGSGQVPGTYVLNDASGGPGSNASIQVVVNPNGTVTLPAVILNPGTGYVFPSGMPVFTLSAGGTPATFNIQLNIVLTLDRIWLEPTSGPGQPYYIYQAYFVAPDEWFRKFIDIRDTTNIRRINYWSYSQADLAALDPQRTVYSDPRFLVPCGVDNRPGTSTPGYTMYELWPQQLSRVPYSFDYEYAGPKMVLPTDNPPKPLTEELLKRKSREVICLFKEAQKGDNVQRGAGANWIMLAKYWHDEYQNILEDIRAIDANLHNNFVNHAQGVTASNEPFSNRMGQLNVGGFPERS